MKVKKGFNVECSVIRGKCKMDNTTGFEIAVIGMSGRFPGTDNIDEFWTNLKNGVEGISFFKDEELTHCSPEIYNNPNYVKAKGVIKNIEYFDADFFGYTPREAEIMDPQLRLLYECTWEALEDSGYSSQNYKGLIGAYIGASVNLGWIINVFNYKHSAGMNEMLVNGSEFFSTRLAYKFNLRGLCLTIQTACSSSLVALHMACQGLISGECNMALAGGVKITYPTNKGYMYEEGSIMSKDGHCRAFDAEASGTVGGEGAGIVLLKRLEDAVADGDHIYAVVKGSAINNDGINKVGYTAPSPQGQAAVIKSALYMSEVEPESISYIETHGTGTKLGDPIEIEGLRLAFDTDIKGSCRIGSVKTNIGHLDNAAGIAGFIKTVLSLKNKQLPPSLNFKTPNPNIDFENSPFYVNKELVDWINSKYPLRAGVSSFGIGGTNAHIILEEAPKMEMGSNGRDSKLITLSAKTGSALQILTSNLVDYMKKNPSISLEDTAYTLNIGRKPFKHKIMLVCTDVNDLITQLSSKESTRVKAMKSDKECKDIVFMFPGQGAQYINMGLDLYLKEPIFKKEVDNCFDILKKLNCADIKSIWYPDKDNSENANLINQTNFAQPVIFIFEYALAKLLIYWGIKPSAMIGHSIGEYTAACMAGVLSLEDALYLVYNRGKLMQSLPKGSMLSVPESEERLKELIGDRLSIAAVNGQASCVLSGEDKEIEAIEEHLRELGYKTSRLHTSHAFHSYMVEPILEEFREILSTIKFNSASIPYISNLTGNWISDKDIFDNEYWIKHIRSTVRFNDGLLELVRNTSNIYLEIGSGKTLSSLTKQLMDRERKNYAISTVKHPKEVQSDNDFLLNALGYLWLLGADIDWRAFYKAERRYRVSLPTYPFEKKYFYAESAIPSSISSKETDKPLQQYKVYQREESESEYIAPRNEKEQNIIEAFEQVIGINRIGINEDFFDIGGDSIKVMELVAKLKKDYKIHVNDVFMHPNAAELAKNISVSGDNLEMLVERLKHTETVPIVTASDEPAIQKELETYRKKIEVYRALDVKEVISYNNILLTGSTGYLGVFLLRELLNETSAKLHLIIRGNSIEEATRRIIDNMNYYFGIEFYQTNKDRIAIYIGDLAEEYLGLEEERYRYLSEEIDCIVHSAGNVSHFGKYQDSYKANVETTKALIEFAKLRRQKTFNHISTLAVGAGNIENVETSLFTEYDCDINQHLEAVYPKSKLEAESLLIKERANGVNVNIFRLGNILFDSVTGKFQNNKEQNAVYTVMKSFIKLGIIPRDSGNITITCVDFISRAIVLLFNKAALQNETYHIENRSRVNLSQYLSSDRLNLGVMVVTSEEFLDYVYKNYNNKDVLPYISMLHTHLLNGEDNVHIDEPRTRTHFLFEKTNLILSKLAFEWNVIDEQNIKNMIEHCREVNYL